jgi:hypothetical protein
VGAWQINSDGRALSKPRIDPDAPPVCLAMPYTWLRPNPVPLPIPFVVKNGSNAFFCTSSVMPRPVSHTDTTTLTYYVLFFIHLESRRVDLAEITVHPDEPWMKQIARNVRSARGTPLALRP